jgi:hypothetical protein
VTKRRLLVGVFLLLAVLAAGYTVAEIHDARLARFSESDLRTLAEQHLSTNSDAAAVEAFLEQLRAHPPDSATIWVYPAEVVAQEYCMPRPCSLVDRGVEPSVQVITMVVENESGWLRAACLDSYFAYFVFDMSRRFSRVLFQERLICL